MFPRPRHKGVGRSAAVRAAPPQQHGSEADRAAVPTGRSKAAAHLRPGCRYRLCPGSRQAVPSAHHRLHRELGRTALLTPVRPHRALFPRDASHAPVRFPSCPLPLHRASARPSCRCSGAVARARTEAVRTLASGPSWARPWATRTLRRPSRARLNCARAAQASCTDAMPLGRDKFGPLAFDLFFYFPNIFKSLQIQKFV
jgi:hypothetical protein